VHAGAVNKRARRPARLISRNKTKDSEAFSGDLMAGGVSHRGRAADAGAKGFADGLMSTRGEIA